MPPKKGGGGASKKAEKKKQDKVIEDKTFGLKNKNKSKSVQNYITSVQSNVRNAGGRNRGVKSAEEMKADKKKMKEAKKAQEAELAALFNDALTNAPKKGNVGKMKSADEPVAVETKEKIVQETIVIAEEERTIEDMIEEQRAKLQAEGKKGTPVNEETLAKWKADRKAKKLAEERRRVQEELKKKSKGKGLSVLSGRALFDYDASLFQDDADAAGDDEMNLRNDEPGEDGQAQGGEAAAGAAGAGAEEVKEGEKGGAAAGAGAAAAAAAGAGVVDESLFVGGDDGDDDALDDLDDDDDDEEVT